MPSRAQSIGLLAKTDTVDAYALALMCAAPTMAAVAPLPQTIENLREIVRAREAAVAAKTALENLLGTATLAVVKTLIKRQIMVTQRAADALAEEAVQAIKADAALARRFEILTSLPGVATITALGLIVNMPELGSLDAKAAGMLAGLAPIPCQSGQRTGPSHIRGGRPAVRTGVYMAAHSAARHNPQLKTFYDRLLDAGKAQKSALTAVMRKLIVRPLLAHFLLDCHHRCSPVHLMGQLWAEPESGQGRIFDPREADAPAFWLGPARYCADFAGQGTAGGQRGFFDPSP